MKHIFFCLSLALVFAAPVAALMAGDIAPDREKLARVADGTITAARASWWGFNEQDSTEILQAALDSGVSVLTIDKQQSPWIVRPLKIPSDIEVILDDEVTVEAKEGEFFGLVDSLLTITGENVTLRGGRGSVLKMRKRDYQNPPYELSEWRHAVRLHAVRNVVIRDLTIRASGGDGVYVGAGANDEPCENVVIRNVLCDDNNRQGISVVTARGLLIEDCVLANTSGLPPQAGIDIEPNKPNQCLVDCVVRRCLMANNAGDGIEIYLPYINADSEPISVTVEDCLSIWNGRNGLSHLIENGDGRSVAGELTIRNCTLRNNRFGFELASKGIDAHAMTIENLVVDFSTALDPNISPITVITCLPDQYPIGKMVWEGITVIDPLRREPIRYVNRTPFKYGFFDITGSLRRKTGADDPGVAETIDAAWLQKHFPGSRQCGFPVSEVDRAKVRPAAGAAADGTAEEPSPLWVYDKGQWFFFAKRGEPVKLTMRLLPPVDPAPNRDVRQIAPVLIDPDGNRTTLEPYGTEGRDYTITPEKDGVWTLKAKSLDGASALAACSVPNAVTFFPEGSFQCGEGTYYFAVPEGTERFAVSVNQYQPEEGTVVLTDPNGKVCLKSDRIDGSARLEGDEAVPGVWTLKVAKTGKEPSGFFLTLYGLAPLVSVEPDKTLEQAP
ncbi:MAG: right-handed parallel beta-helix repeat-containing protein [Thermoguttaceae bacterium]|nr:right-handed parallel beta-helix repeat-containing protein [Thermoguttaceae bacterium]